MAAAFCFALWDIASRNPGTIASDIAHAFTSLGPALRGFARLTIGAMFALVALALVGAVTHREFSVVAISVFIAALAVDAMVGDAIRAGIGIRK